MSLPNFPDSPALGRKFTLNGITYQWDSEKWKAISNADIGLRNELADSNSNLLIAGEPAYKVAKNNLRVPSIDVLRTVSNAFDSQTVNLDSYHLGLNKGGGEFYWDNDSTDPDDGGVTIAVTGVTVGRFKRRLNGFVTPEMFGAVGSGNEFSIISAANQIATQNKIPLHISVAHDMGGGDMQLQTSANIVGVSKNAALNNVQLFCAGSFHTPKALTIAANQGDIVLNVDTSGLVEGEWYRLTSTMNCNSPDAGTMRLGDRIADRSFFGEYVRVRTIVDSASVILFSPVLFKYPLGTLPDTNTTQITTSILRTVTFVDDIKLQGFKVTGKSGVTAINLKQARNYYISCDVKSATNGAIDCAYGLDGKISKGLYQHTTSGSAGAGSNTVKFRSSTNCGVCEKAVVVGGHQGVDFTYVVSAFAGTELGGPCVDCYADDTYVYGCTTDTITSHPGTYGCIIDGNKCIGKPIRIRSPYSKVRNNNIHINKQATLGVLIGHEFLYGSEVHDNTIVGSLTGIRQTQGDFNTLGWANSGAVNIRDNTIIGCGIGVTVDVDSSVTAISLGTKVYNNKIYQDDNYYPMTRGVSLGSYANGVSVYNNDIKGATESGVRYASNTVNVSIYDNNFSNMGGSSHCVRGNSTSGVITDTTTYPAGESEARLFIGKIISDGTASADISSTSRNDLSYRAARDSGFNDAIFSIKQSAMGSLGLGTINIWLNETTTPKRLTATFNNGTGTKTVVLGEYT